jgi:hypothetical protein
VSLEVSCATKMRSLSVGEAQSPSMAIELSFKGSAEATEEWFITVPKCPIQSNYFIYLTLIESNLADLSCFYCQDLRIFNPIVIKRINMGSSNHSLKAIADYF